MAARLSNGRVWKRTELKGDAITRFKGYLRDMHINFETSEAGYGYIHFEVLVDEDELKAANEFLSELN